MNRRKRTAIALRHVAFEDLGLLAPILDREGWHVAYADAAIEDLGDNAIRKADLLIVLGGPIGVYQTDAYPFLRREINLIERRLSAGLPTLGICLGSQLMARALGANVYPGPVKEIGWGPVTLTPEGTASSLAPLGEEGAAVLHWHGDTFDLPAGAVRLAGNRNYENQAFALGDKGLALQFHLEAGARQLEEWYIGHAAELSAADLSVPALRRETKAHADAAAGRAEQVFGTWLQRIGQEGS
ncbi:glutamine amidotransferase [Niveispirillum sp. KHB5.9]|uniref:glutamine amidotransferase n=1 Tax=Niveispirillum sp. KHB5.9 TaxID=3400269 RepID=UPI003A85A249